jgi:organic radical activating enzyme
LKGIVIIVNPYLKNLEKIEFVITYACTGRCKHCSQGEHGACGVSVDPEKAYEAVLKIAERYKIKTVMTFGGEPLLYPETVCRIMDAACRSGVERRQLITNGYFTKDKSVICKTAEKLALSGVNDLLLSVDAFHMEFIPEESVKLFAIEAKNVGIHIRTQPAWLVSRDDENEYNKMTKEILKSFSDMGISENSGNVIFPEGNALKYLRGYFTGEIPPNPYVEDPFNVKCVSFEPDGNVLGHNFYTHDILGILEEYDPLKI